MTFHYHFYQLGHTGFSDWKLILIGQSSHVKSLYDREVFWQKKLNTFMPCDLTQKKKRKETKNQIHIMRTDLRSQVRGGNPTTDRLETMALVKLS